MGVTVHFEGQLRDESAYEPMLALAQKFAEARNWPVRSILESNAKLSRVKNEAEWDYEGPTKGIELLPHPSSEPIRLEFDKDFYVQEYTKTQFAPAEVHIALVELLDKLAPMFAHLEVIDEAEYYESRDERILLRHRDRCFEVLAKHLASDSKLRGPVRLPSGRIADIVSDA
jgi:hypothetical protein